MATHGMRGAGGGWRRRAAGLCGERGRRIELSWHWVISSLTVTHRKAGGGMAAPSPRRAGSGKMPVAVNPAPMAWERVAVLLLLGSCHPSWGTDHCQEGRITDAPPHPVRGAHEGTPRPRPWGDHADPRPRQEWCRGHGSD